MIVSGLYEAASALCSLQLSADQYSHMVCWLLEPTVMPACTSERVHKAEKASDHKDLCTWRAVLP